MGGLDGDVEVDSLPDYIEKWRICLWDKAFIGHFTGADIYGKGTWWKDVKGADNIVKRLIFWYVNWHLLIFILHNGIIVLPKGLYWVRWVAGLKCF